MKKTILPVFILIVAFLCTATSFGAEISLTDEGELVMEDYSEIVFNAAEVTVSDETIDQYLDYMKEDLANMTADTTPEITDEFVREYSLIYFGTALDTVEEARSFIRNTLEDNLRKEALLDVLKQKAQVISYPRDTYNMAASYAKEEIAYYAYQENIEEDKVAVLSGYGSAEEYIRLEAEKNVSTAMILDRIMEEENIAFSEEARDAAIEEYMQTLGYDSYVSVEDFKETAGETWLWLFTEFRYKSDLVYQALKDRIQIVGP